MDKRQRAVLDGVRNEWETDAVISQRVAGFKLPAWLRGSTLIELFNLTEAGLVEMRRSVVLGDRGGELAYSFRLKRSR